MDDLKMFSDIEMNGFVNKSNDTPVPIGELTYATYYTDYDTSMVAFPAGDKMNYSFYIPPRGDTMHNFRLELLFDDELPVVTAFTTQMLDSYDLSKWPVKSRRIDQFIIYDLDFWFSRSDTPLYCISVPYGVRRIEVVMRATTHIKLIRTNGYIVYKSIKDLLPEGINQIGYQHLETPYSGTEFEVYGYQIDKDKKVKFHIKDLINRLQLIKMVVISRPNNNIHELTLGDLRRDDCIIGDNCEIYIGDVQKIKLTFILNSLSTVTMLNLKKIDVLAFDGMLKIKPYNTNTLNEN